MPARINIVGDAASYLRELRRSITGTGELKGELGKLGVTARKVADQQVRASQITTSRLRAEIAAYREVAAAAQRGSHEQVAAANLATRAEQRLARSVGVTAREQRRLHAGSAGFERDASRTARGALVGSGAMGRLGRSVAFASNAFLGGAGAVFAIRAASNAQSNLHEQTQKTDVVFGKASASVEAFSKDALGLAQDEALQTAASFGAILRPLGILPRQAAGLSVQLTKLGVDLASFSNTEPVDALEALRSGIVGQARPLRQYGILLSDARVNALALAETGKKSITALTNEEKVRARIAIILRDSKLAAGDYGRTIGGLANQEREAHKNIRNLEISLGGALDPSILEVTKSLNKYLGNQKNVDEITRDVTEATHALVGGGKTLFAILHAGTTVVGGLKNALELLIGVEVAKRLTGTIGKLGALNVAAEASTGKVALLGTRLGQAGLVAEAGAASFALTTLALHVTGLDKTLFDAGSQAERLAAKIHAFGISDPTKKFKGTDLSHDKQGEIGGVKVTTVVNAARQMLQAGRTTDETMTGLERRFVNLSRGDLQILLGMAARLRTVLDAAGGAGQEAAAKAAHGLALAAAAAQTGQDTSEPTRAPSAPLDRGSRIELRVAQAQVDEARGLRGAKARLLAALKDEIDFDRRWEKVQETLIRKGIGDRKDHAKTLERLLQNEEQAIGQIAAINKKGKRSAADLAAQRNQWFDTTIGRAQNRVQDIRSGSGQLAALEAIAATIQKQIGVTKDVTRKQHLEDSLLDVIRQEGTARGQLAADALDALGLGLEKAQATAPLGDDLRALQAINVQLEQQIRATGHTVDLDRRLFENEQEIRDVRQRRRDATQFKALGLGPTGDTLAPTKKALRTEFDSVSQLVKGTFLDTDKTKGVLGAVRRLLSGQLGAMSADVRAKVQETLDALKGQLNEFDGFNLTKAERHRRSLDRRFADRYRTAATRDTSPGPRDTTLSRYSRHRPVGVAGGRGDSALRARPPTPAAATGAVVSSQISNVTNHFHFEPHLKVIANEPIGHALERSFFRMRVAMQGRG